MNTKDFTATFLVDQTPEEAFNAIINVGGMVGQGTPGLRAAPTSSMMSSLILTSRTIIPNRG